MKSSKKYLQSINPLELIRTKKVLKNNPTIQLTNRSLRESVISLFEYDEQNVLFSEHIKSENVLISSFKPTMKYWLNLDIINQISIEKIGKNVGLHPLIIDDILSENQRPKADEIDNLFTCVIHMLYFNETDKTVESEQVTFVLGKNFLISFQDDAVRDLFNPIREKINLPKTKIKSSGVDYLMYSLLDAIVDHYFVVLDRLAIEIERLEEKIMMGDAANQTMNQINDLRKEVMIFKRYVSPVRELLGSIIRSETSLILESNNKYFKDIYDHTIQANDLCETYRDVISNMRDLYFSQSNMKMNEVMKFLAIVTAILAPATVIGGIFGMNFERIPYLHHQNGFWIATFLMLVIPIIMLIYFKRKGWY